MAYMVGYGFEYPVELVDFSTPANVVFAVESTPNARTGSGRFKVQSSAANGVGGELLWSHNPTEVFLSAAVWSTTLTDNYKTISLGTGAVGAAFGSEVSIRWRSGNYIEAFRDSTSLGLSAAGVYNPVGAWTHIQVWFLPHNTAGTGRLVVKLEDTIVLDITADTTNGQQYCSGVRFHTLSASQLHYWDDIRINDNSGTENNSYPGLARLLPAHLVGAGDNTGLSRGGVDLGANYRQVRDLDDQQSFLQGALNTYDLFTVDLPDLPVGATINNIIVCVGGKTVSGSGTVAPLIQGGATLDQGSDYALTSTGRVIAEAWPLNPADSAAWEEADLSTLQIGVKVRS